MSNFLRYGIVGILLCLAIGSFFNFLAERDNINSEQLSLLQ